MDKHRLVNIIIKDLEEIKNLSEEVANSQDDSSLVIDLALNRARLLCQEIELLRELAGNSVSIQEGTNEDRFDEEEVEVSDISFSEPELEILHFEERNFQETEELQEEELQEDDEEEIIEEDLDEEVQEEKEEDELEPEDDKDDDDDKDEDDDDEDEDEDDELIETEEEDEQDDDIEKEEEENEEEPLQKTNIQVTELSNHTNPGIREIHIDDLDDDDIENVNFSHLPGSSIRPPMREIPKPENIAPEKAVIGETFQKERSLNDSIGENKSESKLANSPITSLRAAIGLNDRFIFIREIFDNNTEKYNTIIDKLDKMEHIQEAVEYLKANLSMQKNEASMKFVDLLKRRFTR